MVVATAVFAMLSLGVISAFIALSRSVKVARQQTIVASLASHYLEVVKNLPYSQIGTLNGNPPGSLADQTNAINTTLEGKQFQIYYEVTYIDDPADGTILLGTDSAPNDYKQVKMFIKEAATGLSASFLASISPKGLENSSNSGALWLKVFNATGQSISGANFHIVNTLLNPNIVLDRQSDSSGNWIEVGLPASVNGYHVVVTKNGYSSDQTYPLTQANPNPTKPDATILSGQVTQVSFAIDLLSQLTVKTLSQTCQNLSGINLNIAGAKLIGTNPDAAKFNQNFTSSDGQVVLNNLEWDTYTPTLLSGQNVMVYGTSPIAQISVLPGASQIFTMILGPVSSNSLLVIVKDSASGAALEGASVHLRKGGSVPQDYYATTGGSVWNQNDWTGGPGQVNWTQSDRYFSDDANLDINSVPTGVRLKKISGRYAAAGNLESSAFDTGAASSFTTLTWQPTSQDAAATLKFQIATNNDNAAWNYKGPDGTSNTYYTVPGTSINSAHNGDRYARYKLYESTTDDKKTPVATSAQINYVSGCFTPGQVIFPILTAGNNYDLDVSLAGFLTKVINNLEIQDNQILEVLLGQ